MVEAVASPTAVGGAPELASAVAAAEVAREPPSAATHTVVLVTGFERFNAGLYTEAVAAAAAAAPRLRLAVYTDEDIRGGRQAALAADLASADIFFGSLIFDYDDVAWLVDRLGGVRTRFVFESALELMALTRVGSFVLGGGGGGAGISPPRRQPVGPPPPTRPRRRPPLTMTAGLSGGRAECPPR